MTKPNDSSDNWLMNEIYPDIANIFSAEIKPPSEIRDTCLVVLDTNVLLVPYTVTKENLDEIADTYQHLAGSKRLYIPGQVAREFVRQRPQKLTELYSQLTRRKVSTKRV